jgi:hypothetical protein
VTIGRQLGNIEVSKPALSAVTRGVIADAELNWSLSCTGWRDSAEAAICKVVAILIVVTEHAQWWEPLRVRAVDELNCSGRGPFHRAKEGGKKDGREGRREGVFYPNINKSIS